MSPQDSTKGSFLTRINIYTVLLGVAFLAMCVACALLALELGRYNWDTKAAESPTGRVASFRPNADHRQFVPRDGQGRRLVSLS